MQLGWYGTSGSDRPPDNPPPLVTNVGTVSLFQGGSHFKAAVYPYAGEAIVWSAVWVSPTGEAAPTVTFPDGVNGPTIDITSSSFFHLTNGTLTVSATANGVPIPGAPLLLATTWDSDGGTGPYGNAAWGAAPVVLTLTKPGYITVNAPAPQPSKGFKMPLPVLPINRLINVAVNLTPSAASAQDLSTFLILGTSGIIDTTERYRSYADLASVAADFGTTLPEYLAAVLWFEQVPQPSNLLIGRWANAATHATLRGTPLLSAQQQMSVFTGISDGRFTYTLDGGSPVTTSPINLTGTLNLPGVAAAISALTAGITFTWDAVYQRFQAVAASTGLNSTISFLSTPGSGTDLSGRLGMQATQSGAYLSQGIAPETALACAALFDLNYGQKWYGLAYAAPSIITVPDLVAVASYVEGSGNKHVLFVTTQDSGVLVSTSTADIASQMQDLNLLRTWVQYSSSNPYAAISAAARILTTDYNGNNTAITLMYKQEPGIVAESINSAQADALADKACNVFANYNNDTAIIQVGTVANGTFLDVVTTTDWLATTIQAGLYNLLYTSTTKIPQTDAGSNMMVNVIENVCQQGVVNGMAAPGDWESGGFGQLKRGDYMPKGYYVYAPMISTQNQADRAKRKAVPIQVAIKLAGAVHTIAMTVNVNQ